MGSIAGGLLGFALGVGVIGRGNHWAVRVLCLLLLIVGCAAGVLVALFDGKNSAAWDLTFGALLGFLLVLVGGGLSALGRAVENRGGGVGGAVAGLRQYTWVIGLALVIGVYIVKSGKVENGAGMPAAAVVAPVNAAPLVSGAGSGAASDARAGAANVAGVAPGGERGGAVEVCDCSLGAVCAGPRGGKYCIDASGNKRYK